MQHFITNQKILAKKAGCGEVHLSRVKKRKVGLGEDLGERLSSLTGISLYVWAAAPQRTLNKQLKDFFASQRFNKLVSDSKRQEVA